MALHVAAEHRGIEHVQGGEQGCRTVTGIVVGLAAGCPDASGRPGRVRYKAWIWLFSSMDSTTARAGGAM